MSTRKPPRARPAPVEPPTTLSASLPSPSPVCPAHLDRPLRRKESFVDFHSRKDAPIEGSGNACTDSEGHALTDAGSISAEQRAIFETKLGLTRSVGGPGKRGMTVLNRWGTVSGAVMFDWWETILYYGIYFVVLGLIYLGAKKQIVAGQALLKAILWQASNQSP